MIVWPEYISLKDWAASLAVDYPSQFIPHLEDENKWQEWGAVLCSTGEFAIAGIPSPLESRTAKQNTDFKDWRSWAKIVYNIMQSDVKN